MKSQNKPKIALVWLRRDLRILDNTALWAALEENQAVLPLFVFDTHILDELPADDPRVGFIYENLQKIHGEFSKYGGSLLVKKGKPTKEICSKNLP
ncbi:MAG: hypothetical protein C4K58_07770 [Flavobacteriaceae bacterium]|nr:MAG: hypothetical protein C4K58_07770 [Flavobacteriaceae bacterium]